MEELSQSEEPKRRRRTKPRDPNSAAPSDAKSLVLSLAKGFRILEVFDGEFPELSLSEIARRANLDTGTTFRLIKTLMMLGYLQQAEGEKRYRLGLKVIDLGFSAFARMDLHTLSRPILRSLIGPFAEAASIGVLEGAEVVYIERLQAGISHMGVTRGMGSRVPAFCSAVGQAILAFMSPEQRLQVLEMRPRPKFTPNTPVTIHELEARMETIRRQGYALSDQELVIGVRAIAAPILDRTGHPLASVSIGAPSFVSTLDELVAQMAGKVVETARSLSRVISASGSIAVTPNH